MSRIGRLPVSVPSGVTVAVEPGAVRVSGPRGKLAAAVSPLAEVKVEGNTVQVRRRDEVLADHVEAAAVDLPRLAADALLPVQLALRLPEVVVERDEVERRSDPDDRRGDVEPAEDQVEPLCGVAG